MNRYTLLLMVLIGHFSASAQWSTEPNDHIVVSEAPDTKTQIRILPDGKGGSLVSWADRRLYPADEDIYAQFINSNGQAVWQSDGLEINGADRRQWRAQTVSDGADGYYFLWIDERLAPNGQQPRIYAQRVNAAGIRQWATDGIEMPKVRGNSLIYVSNFTENDWAVSDGAGGVIFFWSEAPEAGGNWNMYAQRLNAQGQMLWNNGEAVLVKENVGNQANMEVLSDQQGGVWVIHRNGARLGVNRINASGQRQLGENGRIAIDLNLFPNRFSAAITASGKLVVCCTFGTTSLRAQLIDQQGNLAWPTTGLEISELPDGLGNGWVAADASGIYFSYTGRPSGGAPTVYAQKINEAGERLWGETGAVLFNEGSNISKSNTYCFPDGQGGAILTFLNNTSPNSLMAGNIKSNGERNGEAFILYNQVNVTTPYVVKSDINNLFQIAWLDRLTGGQGNVIRIKKFKVPSYTATFSKPAELSEQISIFPNPSSNKATLRLPDHTGGSLQILDLSGKMMQSFWVAESFIDLEASDFPNGLYLISFQNETGFGTAKWMVKR